MAVRFDSSHFRHGTKVKLKAVVETSGSGNPVPPGPYEYETSAEIEIRNSVVAHVDGTLGSWAFSSTAKTLEYLRNYRLELIYDTALTRDEYLEDIKGHHVIWSVLHGGTYMSGGGYLSPPGGGGDINGSLVQGALEEDPVPVALVALVACHAGGDAGFATSYQSQFPVPYGALGFATAEPAVLALDKAQYVLFSMKSGFTLAFAVDLWKEETSLLLQGDPFLTVKGVYRTDLGFDQPSRSWYWVVPQ